MENAQLQYSMRKTILIFRRLKIHTIPGLSTIESLKVIKYISVVNISNKQFLSEFSDCIGEIETPKNIHHIEIKDNVTLVITLAKKILALKSTLQKELKHIIDLGIIEPILIEN